MSMTSEKVKPITVSDTAFARSSMINGELLCIRDFVETSDIKDN